jgi:uncharacterized protein YbbC (DUF1343 family)
MGVRLLATGDDYDPTLLSLALLTETYRMSGDQWEWRVAHFDRLAGTDALREGIVAGLDIEDLRAGWDDALTTFQELRTPYLLYPSGQEASR